MAIWRDISERMKAEKELIASEKKYRLLVDNIHEIIFVTQDDLIKYVNPSALEITGYLEEEFMSRSFIEFIHPDDREKVLKNYLKRQVGEYAIQGYTSRTLDRYGNTRWAELKAFEISWEGRPATLNFINDITERKRAEEDLKKSEKKYRDIFENVSVGIFQTSIQGQLIGANYALAKMFGFASPEEMIANVTDLSKQLYACHEDRERLKGHLVKYDSVGNFEVEGRKKDGRLIWVSINIKTVRDHEGVVLHFEGTSIDIIKRKLAEQTLKLNLEELARSRRLLEQSHSLLTSVLASPEEIIIFALD